MEEDHRPAWGRGCSRGCIIPIRVLVAMMGFLALIAAYTNRVSISHVITKLVFPRNSTNTEKDHVCPKEDVAKDSGYNDTPLFHWSEQLQGLVLGSFYIGYLITHLPGGVLADKYGAKWILGICICLSGVFTVLSPVTITEGKQWGLMTLRILMGAAQGPLFPSLTTLMSAWVPGKERATLGCFVYSGVTAGTVVSNACSGNLLHYYHWSITLYTLGSGTIAWFLFYSLLTSSKPHTHPCIKPKEMAYLNEHIPIRDVSKQNVPWCAIFKNVPLWAMNISQVGHDWGYFVMITCLPKYMNDVLQFSIKSNGYVTSLPFIAMFISTLMCGCLADWLIRSGKMTINLQRKLFTFIAALGPGAFTVVASYCGCNKVAVVASFTIAMFTMGPYYAGQKLSPLDMSPSYAGTLMAISNGLGSFAGIFSPIIVGLMTPNANMTEWRWVFWLGFLILVFSAIVFWIWGSTEVQPFDPKYEKKEDK